MVYLKKQTYIPKDKNIQKLKLFLSKLEKQKQQTN